MKLSLTSGYSYLTSTLQKLGMRQNVQWADLRPWGASPLVSFNHVIDPHFVTFTSSFYTTICNPKPNPKPNLNSDPNLNPNTNCHPTVITDPQIGPRDPQIVTVQIRPAPHFVVCPKVVPSAFGIRYTKICITILKHVT